MPDERIKRWLLHLAGVIVLMWPPLINGQPFFFSDTTAYVRAADLAVQIASHHHIRTAWSRDTPALAPATAPVGSAVPSPAPAHASDAQGGGSAMAGRSPYFGMLLYLGWVTSSFWLFVVAQALVAWWLIGLAMRSLGGEGLAARLAISVTLALLTPIAIYNGFLLADALAGFGILSFLILVRPPADLRRWERAALILLLLMSAAAHFTHIVILAGMTALLGVIALIRWTPWRPAKAPLLIGAGVVIAGLLSVAATSLIVKKALGKPPAAAPVLTARFIVDGPGRAFALTDCAGRFAACAAPLDTPDTDIWLWSGDPRVGGFMAADAATRARLSAEDGKFATAVFRAYPLWQAGMMARNTWAQMTRFDLLVLMEHCFADHACSGTDIPESVRARMVQTPAGHDAWPMRAMSAIHATATIVALLVLALAMFKLRRDQPQAARQLLLWIALAAAAFLINDFLGGAISNPQTRYQERIVWIAPLLALLAAGRAWGVFGFRAAKEPARLVR